MRNVPHIRPFVREDLDYLVSSPTPDTLDTMLLTSSGNCHSFIVDGYPVAAIGFSCLWPGTWQGWAFVTDGIRGCGLFFTKACSIIMRSTAKAFDIRRYNVIVDAEEEEHMRWITLLGFDYEYTMYKASEKGTDILGYVKWMGEK